MSGNTPSGLYTQKKAIKDFEDLDSLDKEQYLLAINDIEMGDGAKVKLKDVISSSVSAVPGNNLIITSDEKLYVPHITEIPEQAGQYGKFLSTDGSNLSWQAVQGGGGAGLLPGQTIFSLDPITNAGLHLLDGTELPVGGSYDAFITNYIIPLYTAHPERFKTEEEWQEIYEEYGVCGYYVYTAGTSVRLPKVIGKVEGTLNVNALGQVAPESLPNITGEFTPKIATGATGIQDLPISEPSGAFYAKQEPKTRNYFSTSQMTTATYYTQPAFDASLSSSTYQDNAPVKEQAVKGYLYIVVSTVTKTDIEVDIDQIQTDLNNKVDVSSLVELDGSLGMPSDRYVDLTLGASDTEYTAPANGYVFLRKTSGAADKYIIIQDNSNELGSILYSQGTGDQLRVILPIKAGHTYKVSYNATGTTSTFRFIYAEGDKNV